jgi:antitoxin HigA-1
MLPLGIIIKTMEEQLPNIHPGEVLEEEFLKPLEISVSQLAQAIRISRARIMGILRKKRRITPDMALRLGKFLGTSAQFWLGLQMDYDLEEEQRTLKSELEHIHNFQEAVKV